MSKDNNFEIFNKKIDGHLLNIAVLGFGLNKIGIKLGNGVGLFILGTYFGNALSDWDINIGKKTNKILADSYNYIFKLKSPLLKEVGKKVSKNIKLENGIDDD